MTNNKLIDALMEELGVEVGEEFNIKEYMPNPFHFNESGNLINGLGNTVNDLIGIIIIKKPDIEKIPVKEMTVSEIEKELGHKIKIIPEWKKTITCHKSILETGMIVTLRNGENLVVIKHIDIVNDIIVNGNMWVSLKKYQSDLTFPKHPQLDVIAIRETLFAGSYYEISKWINGSYNYSLHEPIWERREAELMALSDIEKRLGYKIKVIADKEEDK